MARGTKQLVQALSRRGDREVLRGDLALVGLPGVVYAPASGLGLPAIALGHGWMQPAARYAGLLRHLASWGIVALAPDTQRGPLASAGTLAADLRTALDVSTGVRLGTGQISVDPERLGLVGHGIGGGAAVLAAAFAEVSMSAGRVRAVVLLAPAETHPSAIDAARAVSAPGLVLIAGKDKVAPGAGHAEPIVSAWSGEVSARCLPKASHLGFLQGRHWSDALVSGKPERSTHRLTLALTTAFLLRELTGTSSYDELLDGDVKGAELVEPALL